MSKYRLIVEGQEEIVEIKDDENVEEIMKEEVLSMVDYSWCLIDNNLIL